jgi:hydrogenase maturation protease
MKTLVMGLGNPILTDDGVGIRVVEELEKRYSLPDVAFMPADVDGFQLVEVMAGYDRVVVIDAVSTRQGSVGDVVSFTLDDLEYSVSPGSPHTLNLATAVTWARKLSYRIPSEVLIFGIEARETHSFSESLTDAMSARFPGIVDTIARELASLGILEVRPDSR